MHTYRRQKQPIIAVLRYYTTYTYTTQRFHHPQIPLIGLCYTRNSAAPSPHQIVHLRFKTKACHQNHARCKTQREKMILPTNIYGSTFHMLPHVRFVNKNVYIAYAYMTRNINITFEYMAGLLL